MVYNRRSPGNILSCLQTVRTTKHESHPDRRTLYSQSVLIIYLGLVTHWKYLNKLYLLLLTIFSDCAISFQSTLCKISWRECKVIVVFVVVDDFLDCAISFQSNLCKIFGSECKVRWNDVLTIHYKHTAWRIFLFLFFLFFFQFNMPGLPR